MTAPKDSAGHREETMAQAQRLIHAERALESLTLGQVDAVLDSGGKTYLLRPAQERLRQSENLFSQAFWLSPDCASVMRATDLTLLKVNEAICRLWGKPADEIVGRSPQNFIDWVDEKERVVFMRKLEETGECLNHEATQRLHVGRRVILCISSRMITLDGESCILSVMRDITKERQTQTALVASELRYRRLFESAKDGILILDAETGMVVDVNPFLIRALGYSHAQFLGKAIWELGFFQDVVANEEKFAELRSKKHVRYENLPLKTADGQQIDVEFVSNVYLVEGCKVIQCNVRDVSARRRAEEAIRERERTAEALQLRETALGEVSQGVLICDADRLITYANASFTKMTGYADEEILGRNCSILQGADTNPETVLRIRAALNAGEAFEGEILNYRKDGKSFWNDLSITPVPDEQGRTTRFIGIQRDITERKLAQKALQKGEQDIREERALLRALIDSIPDLIFFKDQDSRFLGCNKAFEKHFDRTEKKLVGLTDYDIVPHESAEAYRGLDRVLLSSGLAQRQEEWLPASDGGGGYFETVKTPYYGPTGESLGLVGISRDITERKRTDENQRLLGERLKLATEAAHVGIWEMDAATMKMEGDARMRILYGLPADEGGDVIEQIYRTMHPDDLERVTAEFEAALRSDVSPLNTEYRIVRANDGGMRVIRSRATVIRDDTGKPLRIVGTNWDVTEERARESKLSEALVRERELARKARAGDRAKSEFLAVMSHEIRTPMNGILGFSELLASSPNLPADCRDYVKTITSSGESLLRILDDILDFSRLEAGGVQIENSQFSPREVLHDTRALLCPHASDKHLEFHIDADEGIPEFLWNDAGRLRQVLLNLVGNAIKFTARGSITLGMRASAKLLKTGKSGVDFYVKDTGPGIAEDGLNHIFEPFSQADSSISRRYGGTGLGLSISRNLVELMGGKLTVLSKVGVGSEFCVTLPIAMPLGPETALPVAIEEGLDAAFATRYPLRILLVEDDPVNRKLMLMMLRKLGYEPAIALNGAEAVEACRANRPECILMDLQMPIKDGLQASREIREIENLAPAGGRAFITALTANTVAEDRKRCFEVGMDDYMNKPFKRALLAKNLRRASEQKSHGGFSRF